MSKRIRCAIASLPALVSCCVQLCFAGEIPVALRQAIQAREFTNYAIDLHVHRPQSGADVLVAERSVGGEWMSHLLFPDAHGELFSEPPIEHMSMVWDERRWDADGRSLTVMVTEHTSDDGRQYPNGLGITPYFSSQSPAALLKELAKPEFTFQVEPTAAGLSIQASDENGGGYRWILSDDNPPAVLQAARFEGAGVITFESEATYTDGDRRFPARVTYRRQGAEAEIVFVQSARMNEEHPRPLGPESIGVEVGTNVRIRQRDGKVRTLGWDGYELKPYGEIVARIRDGELKRGKRFAAEIAISLARGAAKWRPGGMHLTSEWERYVANFIATCKLDDEQSQRAWQIYKAAVESASRCTTRMKPELESIKSQLAAALKAELSTEELSNRLRRLYERQAELAGPLREIFESEIRSRLPRILNQNQAAACNSGQSEPAETSK